MIDEHPQHSWNAPEDTTNEPAQEMAEPLAVSAPEANDAPPIFQNYGADFPPVRIPHFGHFLLLCVFLLFGLFCAAMLSRVALHLHWYGVTTLRAAVEDIHYELGSEAILYLFALAASLFLFPLVWDKGFFAGIQWNGATAIKLRWRLVSAAFGCLVLAAASSTLVHGPDNAPIDRIIRAPGAAWLLFAFGITFAPFFEELIFRGFLLPALCTAVDWFGEKIAHQPRMPLGENDAPQWTTTAMIAGSIATSIPFAAMHAEQTGNAIGPLLLLGGVSLVLCAVRLKTKSLAASVCVHALYNFVLFSIMLIGTQGFKHLDQM
jgi:hypothetical protein